MKTKTFTLLLCVIPAFILSGCKHKDASEKRVMTVEQVLKKSESLAGKTITVKGLCTHVCEKSGMKLFLQGNTQDKTVRAESSSTLGKFDTKCVDKNVVIKGTLVEERIDEAYVKKLETQIKENTRIVHGEGGQECQTEQIAEGVAAGSSEMDRVNDFRKRIAERSAKEGKNYLSMYHIAADSYRIVK